jgi:predicted ATPase
MLKKVEISNFKAHEHLKLEDIPPLSFIVGKNNVGKSSVLQAIAKARYGDGANAQYPTGSWQQYSKDAGKGGYIRLWFQSVDKPHSMSWDLRSGERINRSEESRANVRRIRYLSALRDVSGGFQYEPFDGKNPDMGHRGEHAWNTIHHLRVEEMPEFDQLKVWLKRFGMGTRGIGIPSASVGHGKIRIDSFGSRIDLLFQGSGLWTVLPILTQGVLCGEGSLMLIEEPESHLHRGAMDEMAAFFGDCVSRGIQIMCTTHSIDMLAAAHQRIEEGVLPKNSMMFHLTRDEEGKTSVTTRDLSVFRQIRMQIKDDLGSIDL